MDIPHSIYDPQGELHRSLSPSSLFPPRTMGILFSCILAVVIGLSLGQRGVALTHWTTVVGLLLNYAFVICWAIVAVSLTIWRRPMGRVSAVTLGMFVLGSIFRGLAPEDGYVHFLLWTLTDWVLIFALAVGLALHVVNWEYFLIKE